MRLSNYINQLGVIFGVLFFSITSLTSYAVPIQVGDTIELSLRGVPVSEQAKVHSKLEVRASGVIRIPMINKDVRAAGRSPEVVEREIEALFKKAEIYRAPTISVQVHAKKKDEEVMKKVVIVGGEVRRPGRIQYRQGMTLMEALQQAGGRGTFASKYLYLTRKDAKSGELKKHKYNYKDSKCHALKVYANDVINVPVRGPGWKDKG